MKFSSIVVLVEAVAAARLTNYRREAHAKRAVARKSHPRITVEASSNASYTEYSQNWAGSVIISEDISSVTAKITIPSVSGTAGSCASAWVGIDGDTCATAILQTGVDFCYENGQSTYDAWYEWYPDYAYDFEDLTFSEGDIVTMTVTATSATAGTAVIENETTGQSATQTFNGNVQGDLCRTNAEWIVEDFEQDGALVAFADFGTVTFTDATAAAGGQTLSAGSGTILDIQQDSTILTSCSASTDQVTCTYE